MCREAVEVFIVNRFKHYSIKKELSDAYSKLLEAIEVKHAQVHGIGLEVL